LRGGIGSDSLAVPPVLEPADAPEGTACQHDR
jgi:hypothetical protein